MSSRALRRSRCRRGVDCPSRSSSARRSEKPRPASVLDSMPATRRRSDCSNTILEHLDGSEIDGVQGDRFSPGRRSTRRRLETTGFVPAAPHDPSRRAVALSAANVRCAPRGGRAGACSRGEIPWLHPCHPGTHAAQLPENSLCRNCGVDSTGMPSDTVEVCSIVAGSVAAKKPPSTETASEHSAKTLRRSIWESSPA